LRRVLSDPAARVVIVEHHDVEHHDRLARFGAGHRQAARGAQAGGWLWLTRVRRAMIWCGT